MNKDIVGHHFGDWLVIRFSHVNKTIHGNRKFWLCRCVCNKERPVYEPDLLSGKSKNCGCYRTKLLNKFSTKHGLVPRDNKPPEFRIWNAMKTRCYNKNSRSYKDYGGRGIKICARWLESFANFLTDMGERPSKDYSIERTNVNGDYEPDNCIWLLKSKQARNKTSNKLTLQLAEEIRNNTSLSRSELAKLYKVDISTINRVLRGDTWCDNKTI